MKFGAAACFALSTNAIGSGADQTTFSITSHTFPRPFLKSSYMKEYAALRINALDKVAVRYLTVGRGRQYFFTGTSININQIWSLHCAIRSELTTRMPKAKN